MQYKVVFDDDLQTFVEKVNAALIDGWKLEGGIATLPMAEENASFLQAMTK
jgi:hypothetical protein